MIAQLADPGFEFTKPSIEYGQLWPLPVIFGVITVDTIEQAIERAGAKLDNKGFSAAMSAVEMASLFDAV